MKLVDFPEVERMAADRGCKAARVGLLGCEITDKAISIINSNTDGFWKALDVMTACRDAHLRIGRPFPITPPKEFDTEHHGLHEDLIVEALVADGVMPYKNGGRTQALEALIRSEHDTRGLAFADNNPRVKQAAIAVRDAGLAELTFGPRGGWTQSRIIWALEAHIAVHLDQEEDAAFAVLLGLPPDHN